MARMKPSHRWDVIASAPDISTERTLNTREQVAHALILVPSVPQHSVAWYPLARFVLSWQVRWLRRAGVTVTLVVDDSIDESGALATVLLAESADGVDVLTWERLAGVRHLSPPREGAASAIIVMLGPMLTDCKLEQILGPRDDHERPVTVVRQRAAERLPVAYVLSPIDFAAYWPELGPTLRAYASQPNGGLMLPVRMSVRTARCELVRTGDRREARQIETLWDRCAPLAGLVPMPGAPSVYHVSQAYPSIAPTALLRGPMMIGEDVVVEERASIGPWVLLERGCHLGRDSYAEMATFGAGARIGQESCVYACIADARVQVSPATAVLKAHVLTHSPFSQLLPSSEAFREPSRSYLVLKRLLDLMVGSLALVVISPLLCVAMLLCLAAQGWPIFFLHERIGAHGEHFRVLKLRTMRRDAHLRHNLEELETSDRFKLHNDQRVTAVGRLLRKTSMDELPQLFNVLVGQMTLVGPRPIVPKEAMRFGVYAHDLVRVKPGMTGLWQVSGRSDTTYARRIMLDVLYGDRCSMWLDLSILLRTIPAVLFLRGSV